MVIRTTLHNPHTWAKEGDYVAYTDYAALEAENANLREAFAIMEAALRDMGQITEALRRRLDDAGL